MTVNTFFRYPDIVHKNRFSECNTCLCELSLDNPEEWVPSVDDSRPLQPYRGLDEVIYSIVMIRTRTLDMKKAILIQNGGFELSEIRRVRLLAI